MVAMAVKNCVKTVVVTVNDSLSQEACVFVLVSSPFPFISKTITCFCPICSYPFMLAAGCVPACTVM